jgi:hypothetical protein
MQAREECVKWIASLVDRRDPDAVTKAEGEAATYLSHFRDAKAFTEEHGQLLNELRASLPATALADEVIKAIDQTE